MNRIVDTTEYLDTVCSLLREGKRDVPVPVKGVSMRPFLRDQDMAYLIPVEGPVKPGDILLFRRSSGRYILHRVHKLLGGGRYLMLGDSQRDVEVITDGNIRGKVSFVRIQDRNVAPGSFHWWFYAYPWRWLAPARGIIGRLHSLLKRK